MKFIIDNEVIDIKKDKYLEIDELVKNPNIDLANNEHFKQIYCGHYFPAQISNAFKKEYFEYMQECRNNPPTFRKAITDIYSRTKKVQYSLASKLVHTLNNDSPILDQHVLRLMGFQKKDARYIKKDDPEFKEKKEKDAKDRIDHYCNIYETIKKEYLEYEDKQHIKDCIKQFDEIFPTYSKLTYVKKIDCLIFRLRDERITSILELTDKDSK